MPLFNMSLVVFQGNLGVKFADMNKIIFLGKYSETRLKMPSINRQNKGLTANGSLLYEG